MPKTINLLGQHRSSPEWYTPDFVWEWIEYVFDQPRDQIFDPCPVGGTGGLGIDWSVHRFIYVNPPSPALLWGQRTISYKGQNDVCLLYLSFSESSIWQVPELLTVPTILIRRRIKFIPSKPITKNMPSNYNALHLVNGDVQTLARFKHVANYSGTLIKSVII